MLFVNVKSLVDTLYANRGPFASLGRYKERLKIKVVCSFLFTKKCTMYTELHDVVTPHP